MTKDLEALLDEELTRELAEKLEVDQTTVLRRLHEIGKVNKLGKWVPYQLSEYHKIQRLNTCVSLLAKYKKKRLSLENRNRR